MARNHTQPGPAGAPATAPPVPTMPAMPPMPAGPRLGARTRAQADDALDGSVRRALEKYSPAYVVIDGNHDIVRFSGRTARYLGPSTGSASLNLFSLLHRGLRSAARTSVQQASSQHRVVVQEGLGIDVEGQRQALRLIVAPLQEADGGKDLYVVAFDDIERTPANAPTGGAGAESARISVLEQELEHTRQQLHAAIEQQETANEELMSANEEYQSVNEELQSANGELEASKGEMQSINEELQTINAELQGKNDTLARLNNDLQNLMESTQIATLFLDTALHVTGFTSGMGQVFHLREGDRGRPITEIATRVHYSQLQDDVKQVLRTLSPVERVLRGGDGVPTYLLRARPYRTVDNVIDGTVLTFVDITEREEQEAERARLAAIVEWSKEAIIGYSLDGTITSWNAGAERVLGYQPRTVIGQSLAMLLPAGQDGQFQRLLAACADPEGVSKFEGTWRRQNGSTVAIDLSCSPVKDASGNVVVGSAIARDVTDRRRADRALHDSEFRLAAILEQTSMGLAQTDVEGRFELVNPRFCDIVGRTARELYRLRVRDILHPDDVQQNLDLISALLAERSHFQLDVRFVRPDGSVVWTSNSVTAMLGGDLAPQHIISAVLDITQQKLASQHVALMLDELNHRVKNTLATVQAIAMQTLTQSTSMDAFRAAFGARLLALSNTHNLLAHDAWTGAQLRDIIASELAPYLRDRDSAEQARARLAGGDLLLNPKMALALSMAIHELATNASKYGALSGTQGDVTVRWHARDEGGQPWLHLSWTESGGPAVTPPARRGFGTRLITEGLAFELDGEATLDYAETGVSCVIHVPLSEAAP